MTWNIYITLIIPNVPEAFIIFNPMGNTVPYTNIPSINASTTYPISISGKYSGKTIQLTAEDMP